MLISIPFTKMHGLGNDFVIVKKDDVSNNCDFPQLAIKISNRNSGIGCDQFILYSKKAANNYEVIVYNHDGSLAEACGNAFRCITKLINKYVNERTLTLNVNGRNFNCIMHNEDEISVNMGEVSFTKSWIPSSDKLWQFAERYMIEPREIICADIGNPHLIIFSTLSMRDKQMLGEKLQASELFPQGINVNFAYIKEDKICLSVWERGTGLTLACGSGACASFAAAIKLGFASSPAEVVFETGSLKMLKQQNDIIMTGPATLVAKGEFYYE